MANEDEKQPQPSPQQSVDHGQPDWFLARLVQSVNTSDLEMSITLLTGGMLVSGMLVGGVKYFEGFSRQFPGPQPESADFAESMKASIGRFGDIYRVDTPTIAGEPTFVHIKDAKFFTPAGNPIPAHRGLWWRGRLSQVVGFNLGSLSLD